MSDWNIIREPNDALALRLSIGQAHVDPDARYIVYRGDTADCLALLKVAVAELEKHLEEQGE